MDYRIIPIDMPLCIKGCAIKHEDFCTILVNARLTIQEQREAAIHELDHIRLGHLEDIDTPVSVKEAEVNKDPYPCG